jgi:hypothetical protein
LEIVHSRYREEVREIREFALNITESLLTASHSMAEEQIQLTDGEVKLTKKRLEKLLSGKSNQLVGAPYDLRSMKGFIELFRWLADILQSAGAPDKLVDKLREGLKPFVHIRYLMEMVVVYLVTIEEAFVTDYLRALFHVRPSLLRTEKKLDLTFEEACDLGSYEALRNYLENSAIEPLTHGGIDELSSYFEKRLNLRLEEFPNWGKVREASYRRNLIVHNKGEVNKTYREKIGYKGADGYMGIDKPYISNLADAIVNFIDFTHDRISSQCKVLGD